MREIPGGRFCELCQKAVLDASDGDTSQLDATWHASGGQVCARLPRPSFALHPLQQPRRFPRLQKAAIILLAALGLQQNPAFAQENQIVVGKVEQPAMSTDAVLHFSGQILETTTKDPLEGAQIVLMRGEELMAGAMADSAGRFHVWIPEEMVSRKDRYSLKVRYFEHVFIQEGIKPKGRHFAIELNAQIWLEAVEVAAPGPLRMTETWVGLIHHLPTTRLEELTPAPSTFQRYPSLEEWMWMNLSEVKRDRN